MLASAAMLPFQGGHFWVPCSVGFWPEPGQGVPTQAQAQFLQMQLAGMAPQMVHPAIWTLPGQDGGMHAAMLAATWQHQQLQMGRLGPGEAPVWGLQQTAQQQQLPAWLPPHHSVGFRAGGGHLQQLHHHQHLQQGHGPGLGQAGLQRVPQSGTKHLGGLPQLKRAGQAGQHWRAWPCAPSVPAVSPPSSCCDQDSAVGTTDAAEEASEAGPGPQDACQAAPADDGQSSGASTSGRGAGEQCREAGDQWEWLTEGLLKEVMGHLHPHSLRRMRLVCQRWRRVVDSHVQVLRPQHAQVHDIARLFPGLTSLNLSECQNVRNRNLLNLSRSKLRLQELRIGHMSSAPYGKPRITNQALHCITEFKELTTLVLSDCSAVTTAGLQVFSSLVALRRLTVNNCPRVGDNGMQVLRHLPQLTHLNLCGCIKVTNATLKVVTGLTKLESLTLGFTRVLNAGVAHLSRMTALTELHFFAEDVSDVALQDLQQLTGLQVLGLSNCYEVTGGGVLALAEHATGLCRLELYNCEVLDEHLEGFSRALRQLEVLFIPGTFLSERGLHALAALPRLQTLGLECFAEGSPSYLSTLSCLTQLTALQVQRSFMPRRLMRALAALPRLSSLALSGLELHEPGLLQQAPTAESLALLCKCTHLTALDLSYVPVNAAQVALMLDALPCLEDLCLFGCLVPDEEREALMGRHPHVDIHCRKVAEQTQQNLYPVRQI